MFKNRSIQMKFVKDEEAEERELTSKLSSYEVGAQIIVVGRHLTIGVMCVIGTYMLGDAVRQIAINNLSK